MWPQHYKQMDVSERGQRSCCCCCSSFLHSRLEFAKILTRSCPDSHPALICLTLLNYCGSDLQGHRLGHYTNAAGLTYEQNKTSAFFSIKLISRVQLFIKTYNFSPCKDLKCLTASTNYMELIRGSTGTVSLIFF